MTKLGHTAITWPFTPQGADQAMQDIASLGYPGIELFGFVIDAYPGGVEGLRAHLAECHLQLAAAYCSASLIDPGVRASDVAKMVAWAEKVHSLRGDVIVVGADSSAKPAYSRAEYAGLCKTLDEIGLRCADLGVKACFHPHTGTPVETSEQIDMVMSGIDPRVVCMAPDTGQIAKGGSDPVEVLRTYREVVGHVHLKDYVGGEITFNTDVVDLPAIVHTLEAAGFGGWWMVELDGTPRAPRAAKEAAAISKRYLDRLVSANKS
jgi:inosose dehydratase